MITYAIKTREFRRQMFHLMFGLLILTLLRYNIIGTKTLLAVFSAGIIVSAISRKKRIPILARLLDKFERPSVIGTFPWKGALFLVLGALVSTFLFEKDIALASIAILAIGDSVSPLIGSNFGKIKHPFSRNNPKMIEGSIAGTIAAFLGAVIFVSPLEAALAAAAAMAIEAAEMKINDKMVDDNIIVPLVAGTVISVMRKIIT